MDDRALWICELDERDATRFASLSVAATVLMSAEVCLCSALQEVLEDMNTYRAECVAQSLSTAAALCEQQGQRARRLGANLREMAEIASRPRRVACAPRQRRGDDS